MTRISLRGTGALVPATAAVCFLAWAALVVAVPFGAAADEISHAAYGGFIERHGRLADASRDSTLQAQHPPLYYLFMAAFAATRPVLGDDLKQLVAVDPDKAIAAFDVARFHPPDRFVLPAPRRIEIAPSRWVDDPFAPRPGAGLAENETLPTPGTSFTSEGHLLFVRAVGGVFLALMFAALLRVGRGASEPALGVLAALAVFAVPQNAANFAFVNSDQFAILFSTLAFATLAAPSARPLAETRRPLAAGALLGLAVLSKLFAAGACVACAVFLISSNGAPFRRRLRALFVMTATALLLGAPWIVRQYAFGAGVDPVLVSGLKDPAMLRAATPDAAWFADFIGRLAPLWFSSATAYIDRAGDLLELLAAAFPLLAVVGGGIALFARDSTRLARAAAGAFLSGLVVQSALVAAANIGFASEQGRYLHVLLAPGVLALAAGARATCGERAKAALVALLMLSAAGTLWVVFGRVVPSFCPPSDRYDGPGFVAYVDAGHPRGVGRLGEIGTSAQVRDAGTPRPEDTVVWAFGSCAVRLPRLVSGEPYRARVRLRRLHRQIGEAVVLSLDELSLGGPYSPETTEDWLDLPFVAPKGADRIEGPWLRATSVAPGGIATLAEVQILRAEIERPTIAPTESVRVVAAPVGTPPTLAASFKLQRIDPRAEGDDRAFVDRGFARATSYTAREFPSVADPRAAFVWKRAHGAPTPGVYEIVVIDDEGVAVGPEVLRWTGPRVRQDGARAELTVPPEQADGEVVATLEQVGPSATIDRIELRGPAVFRFLPLESK